MCSQDNQIEFLFHLPQPFGKLSRRLWVQTISRFIQNQYVGLGSHFPQCETSNQSSRRFLTLGLVFNVFPTKDVDYPWNKFTILQLESNPDFFIRKQHRIIRCCSIQRTTEKSI